MSVLQTRREGPAFFIGIDRAEKRNALDQAMVDEFSVALDQAAQEPSVLIIHSTTPGMFVSGADIAELRQRTAADALRRINGTLFDRVATHPWPSIAVVDGPALGGGCELALACDFRLATDRARFGQPEPSLGIMAAAGANWRLAALAGLPTARRMLLGRQALDPEQAMAVGLVDAVVDQGGALEAAVAMAADIATASWQALELTKLALAAATDRPIAAFDATGQALLFESEEKKTRMDAFLRRRGTSPASRKARS